MPKGDKMARGKCSLCHQVWPVTQSGFMWAHNCTERYESHARPSELLQPAGKSIPLCFSCGGEYRYDTSVPSPLWNNVVRSVGAPDTLCLACIMALFAKARKGFTAQLSGAGLDGISIDVMVNGALAESVAVLLDENNRLRRALIDAHGVVSSAISSACCGESAKGEDSAARPGESSDNAGQVA